MVLILKLGLRGIWYGSITSEWISVALFVWALSKISVEDVVAEARENIDRDKQQLEDGGEAQNLAAKHEGWNNKDITGSIELVVDHQNGLAREQC